MPVSLQNKRFPLRNRLLTPPQPEAKPNPALFIQGYPAFRVAPNPIGDASGSCRSPRRAVLGDKTKARQQAGGGEGCWRREMVHGGPRDAEPSTPVPGTGERHR